MSSRPTTINVFLIVFASLCMISTSVVWADDAKTPPPVKSSGIYQQEMSATQKVAPVRFENEVIYPEAKVTSVMEGGFTVEVTIPEFRFNQEYAGGQVVDRVLVNGFGGTMEQGWPCLPVGYFTLDLPRGAVVQEIVILDSESEVREGLRLEPEAIKNEGEELDYPGIQVEAETLSGANGESVMGLAVYPVSWTKNPYGKESVELFTRLRIWVSIQ